MAESTVATVLRLLGPMVIHEAVFLRGVRDDAELLRAELRRMQIFVRDADARRRGSDGITNWVVNVRAAAYDSEDVLAEADLHARRRAMQCGSSGVLVWCADLVALHKLGEDIRGLRTRIDDIHKGAVTYGFANNPGDGASIADVTLHDHDLQWVAADGDYSWVVGEERDEIITELIGKNVLEICVVCIVGMGGSGKSTLARKIYHSHGKQHFEAFCWLTVSQQYKFLDLIKYAAKRIMNIKRSFKVEEERKWHGERTSNDGEKKSHGEGTSKDGEKKSHGEGTSKDGEKKRHGEGTSKDGEKKNELTVETLEKMDEEEVMELLREELAHRRFLIVLDDVWRCDSYSEINKIISVFPDVNNGSRILLTTRDLNVPKHVNKMKTIHQMKLLDQEQSWELLEKKAFQRHQISCSSDSDRSRLTPIGKELAMQCGGLPLALVVLGGYLSRNLHYDIWLGLVKDLDWETRKKDEPIWGILARSYNDLQQHQKKSCFLYLASFPEDHNIRVKRLIRLLIAEGFVPQEDNRTMEDTAREYISELAQRCMLQVVDRSKVDGSIKSVVLHDILRDWAVKEARREGFFNIWCHTTTVPVQYSDSMPAYRLALHNYSGRSQIVASMPKIRTLWVHGSFSKDLGLHSLPFLRVLDLYGIQGLQRLPSCIGKLMHLRYLGVQGCGKGRLIGILPPVFDLLNLQTLDARSSNVRSLPRYFWDVPTLRHIHLGDVYSWAAPEVGCLRLLQTFEFSGVCDLEGIFIRSNKSKRKENSRKWTFMIEALSEMKQLVSLHLKTRYSGSFITTATFPMKLITVLSGHNCLRVLDLHGRLSIPTNHLAMLPCNLKKLKLTGSELLVDPMPELGKLPNLVVLTLGDKSYRGTKMTCSANAFPMLQYLTFEDISSVSHWDIEVGAFPSLIQLNLFSFFTSMIVPPQQLLCVKSLQELNLRKLNSENVSSQNIEELRGMGCKVNVGILQWLEKIGAVR